MQSLSKCVGHVTVMATRTHKTNGKAKLSTLRGCVLKVTTFSVFFYDFLMCVACVESLLITVKWGTGNRVECIWTYWMTKAFSDILLISY